MTYCIINNHNLENHYRLQFSHFTKTGLVSRNVISRECYISCSYYYSMDPGYWGRIQGVTFLINCHALTEAQKIVITQCDNLENHINNLVKEPSRYFIPLKSSWTRKSHSNTNTHTNTYIHTWHTLWDYLYFYNPTQNNSLCLGT